MCKSFVKITAILFLILCIFEVNAKRQRGESASKNDVTFPRIRKYSLNNTDVESVTNNAIDTSNNITISKTEEISKGNSTTIIEEINGNEENPIIPVFSKVQVKETSTTTTTTLTSTSTVTTTVTETESTTVVTTPTTHFINTKTDEIEHKTTTGTTSIKENNISESNESINSFDSQNIDSSGKINSIDNSNDLGNNSSSRNDNAFNTYGTTFIIAVGAVSVGLVAVSSYRVLKRKSEMRTLKNSEYYSSSSNPPSLMTASDYNNKRISLVNSLIYEGESEGNMLYYNAKGGMNNQNPTITIDKDEQGIQNEIPIAQYRMSIQSEGSLSEKSKSIISVNRNSRSSVIRHSFLNPNINIIRTGIRTQQLFEATNDHPAIIETFPSMERPFVPAVPVQLEESDVNSLHPHSIYQMYQDEMEYENYYAYTIDDKEYIIDPTTNRVLEIHDLNTDEYMLVEEELYLDFSGSSDDSDSDKQTI
ncbi:hypothetical protein BCR36DRAFT_4366 [Piromyces finnis]|uniref:Mid2 domain-containing protein n=1 Tax=Piromyces finnis TaxID=1754191 RepID=A0A1Y1VNH8_9FUNG|nr:hypothetical protein BCR36DRAFT_4366 [Piromyces finnis]|eukprot:ORX60968.1 hypothetical protein BCR36DRAFT_4366 [Piromyces finnis]